jgi:hypothetical protein
VILVDVNVLVYANRVDADDHRAFRSWLGDALDGYEPVAVADIVLSGVVRILTNSRIYREPTKLADALSYVDALRDHANVVQVAPGTRHWHIFRRLCTAGSAKGNLVPDAYLAALAIEAGCEWITTDRDFARFEGLRWRHPLAGS